MNVIDALAQLPPNTVHQTAMKVGGFVGGSTFLSGFIINATEMQALGSLFGGTAALITVIYSIYKGSKKK